eukprot:Gregarina_sp_Poly_1__2037@NODE_1535_length_3909_cov_331_545549_g1012_i0_p1_GENE_NODE_1535_length_3909_cov_331_545549_g1012_i0NODE_1535_length_3909_cov_331_545549_g1012_i0_p1_ORF_typecomplete_len452_score60_98_NODE_1535_length_3909_cov_331_545549_g1012_i011732528
MSSKISSLTGGSDVDGDIKRDPATGGIPNHPHPLGDTPHQVLKRLPALTSAIEGICRSRSMQRHIFEGSHLLRFASKMFSRNSLLAREGLMRTALHSPRLLDAVDSASPDEIPFLYFQSLLQAVHSPLLQLKAVPLANEISAERSSKLLQMVLPGFPVDKAVLAQLMIRNGNPTITTSIPGMIIQSLFDSYKNPLSDDNCTINSAAEVEFGATSSPPSNPSIFLDSTGSNPNPSQESTQEGMIQKSPFQHSQSFLETWEKRERNHLNVWMARSLELFKILRDKNFNTLLNSVKSLVYQRVMILETQLVCWVAAEFPEDLELKLGRLGFLCRPWNALDFLSDLTILKELKSTLVESASEDEVVESFCRWKGINLLNASPFTATFWSYEKAPALGSPDFTKSFRARLAEYDCAERTLSSQKQYFDQEVSLVLKMILSSLESTVTNTRNSTITN